MSSLLGFLAWYLAIAVLGALAFPIVHRLFPALEDRGYALTRIVGLLLWAYVFWLLASLGLARNDAGGMLAALLPLVGASLAAILADKGSWSAWNWMKSHPRTVVITEALFLMAFAAAALLRAGNPSLDNAEKPMELMFINAIMRSPTFPPRDAWLSGYSISYYYFGYVMTAMLAVVTGVPGSMAHNLMMALVFGLGASAAYGIVFNLLSTQSTTRTHAALSALLAPVFLLIASNMEGLLEVLHRLGLFWTSGSNFWTWLGIKDLTEAPAIPYGWIPDRYWWWWRASRVITDIDFAGGVREVIDEFPFFSFLHGDLHPHVLAIPFDLLAVAVALNVFRGAWRGEARIGKLTLPLSWMGIGVATLVVGSLAFLNTWDVLFGGVLIVGAVLLYQAAAEGWSWRVLERTALLGLAILIGAIVLFFPFYVGFSSQVGGVLPNLDTPTQGAQFWVMFAPLFIPMLAYLAYRSVTRRHGRAASISAGLAAGVIILLWLLSILLALIVQARDPSFAGQYLAAQGFNNLSDLLTASSLLRLARTGTLITLALLLWPALLALINLRDPEHDVEAAFDARTDNSSAKFVPMLILFASLLVLAPEFIYLRDQFGTRMNTIFKFYYQAWLLWGLAAAFASAYLLAQTKPWIRYAFAVVLVLVLGASLVYPVLAINDKTNGLRPGLGFTLDGFRQVQTSAPDEAAAIQWLRAAPDGVIAEAVGGSYTSYGRISTFTGLPSVLGWPGHESQWRGGGELQGSREADIAALYSTGTWRAAAEIMSKYGIRYVYVGALEQQKYSVRDGKFAQNMLLVFQQGNTSIYEMP